MKIIEFTIIGFPVAEARARFTRQGVAYTPAKTRAWKQLVRKTATAAAIEAGLHEPIAGPVALYLEFVMPVPPSWTKGKKLKASLGELQPTSKPDIDNLAKAIMDGINNCLDDDDKPIIWHDDSQVVRLVATKRYGQTGLVNVNISERAP